ncbi:MAG: glycine cleavage system protein GcvH [Rhabdochlamydiaceae bacterium]|nr:glycine cleavage system protein GcvH [Candidatus Amphrikana amoebophyrae]
MKKVTQTHEWVEEQDGISTVGITKYAREEMGEVVYIELPKVGQEIKKGEEVVILESTKAATDISSPIGGKIIEVNEALKENLALINDDPEGKGWFFKLT